jgi:hypothetical protein
LGDRRFRRGGITRKLRTFLASGEGRTVQKLSRLPSESSESKLAMNLTGEFPGREEPTPAKFRFVVGTRVEPWQ